MGDRLNPYKAAPDLAKAMQRLEQAVRDSGLDPILCELVKIRASQINRCGYCLHLHTQDARRLGEAEERLYLVSAWRESSYFSAIEQAALAWTEGLTLISERGAPADLYDDLRQLLADEEIAKLTFLIMTINAWNRLAIAFHMAHPRAWRAA